MPTYPTLAQRPAGTLLEPGQGAELAAAGLLLAAVGGVAWALSGARSNPVVGRGRHRHFVAARGRARRAGARRRKGAAGRSRRKGGARRRARRA